jgi:cell division protein FtsI/penicillin-binding protein 2
LEISGGKFENPIVTEVYEPGPTLKAITVSAALNEKVITPETKFDCAKQTVEFKGKTLSLPNDWKPFNGITPIKEILENSSNRGIAQISLEFGPEKMYDYIRLFGFGEKIDGYFDGESRGY